MRADYSKDVWGRAVLKAHGQQGDKVGILHVAGVDDASPKCRLRPRRHDNLRTPWRGLDAKGGVLCLDEAGQFQ